jgi:hypothetical protein
MRAQRTGVIGRSLLSVATAGLAILAAGLIHGTGRSFGDDPPPWPRYVVAPGQDCYATGQTCLTCPNAAGTGCTAGIPNTWAQGTCEDADATKGCGESTFNCGMLYSCATGLPSQTNCFTGGICKFIEPVQ